MFEITVGDWTGKKTIRIDSDKSLTIEKSNGSVIRKWRHEEIFGIAYSPANMMRSGALAIASSLTEAQKNTSTAVTMMDDSILVSRGDHENIERLIKWFEENRHESAESNFDLEARSAGSFLGIQGNFVVIIHSGFLNAWNKGGIQGEKRIPIKSILSIQFKDATSIMKGYIQFETAGGSQLAARGGVAEAAGDENSVLFTESEMPKFKLIRDKVSEIMERQGEPQRAEVSSADELLKFAQLLERGLITQEEFDLKKKQILGL